MTNKRAIEILDRRSTIPGEGVTWEEINEAIDLAIKALDPRNNPHYDECDYCKYEDSLDDYPCNECHLISKWEAKE
jgi:hypothetical protein